ncbi:MAG: ribonuclease E/G, partial [Lachnospiraceae bacterium]|nr:ribonuclease E/G [Lachnospiraceae bacterium]
GKIVVTRIENAVVSAVFEGNEMTQVSLSEFKDTNILGNIYLGKVQNIIKNIGAEFVEIQGGRACYLPLEKNECPVFANPKNDGKLRVGDEIIVQVVKEDKNSKAPVLSAMFSLTGKYVVLVHGKKQLGISAKITDDKKRKALRDLITPHIGENFGFIVRTNALNVWDDMIEK